MKQNLDDCDLNFQMEMLNLSFKEDETQIQQAFS